MSTIKNNLEVKDLIAVFLIIGGFYLILNGADGFATATVSLVAGYYFGRRENEMK